MLLRRIEEGAELLNEHRRRCVAEGASDGLTSTDAIFYLCKILQGQIAEGIGCIVKLF